MNKAEIVSQVAEKAQLTRKQAETAVNAMLDSIKNSLAQQEKVSLVGFGTFEVRERKPRQGRNPQTGQPVAIAGGKVPGFKAGKELKQAVSL